MLKRIIAIVAIFVCTAVAWAILGSTIFYRTYNAESGLSGRVASTWGAPQGQAPPAIAYEWPEEKTVEVEEKGRKITRTERQIHSEVVKIDASRVAAAFHIDYRQKGLLWFSTYKVDFDGAYTFQNPTSREEEFVFRLPFPAQQAVYDNVQLLLDDKPLTLTFSGSQARDFHLLVKTDFSGFDFPDNSLSPTEKRQTANGWELEWNYQNLVSGFDIALKMPQKLQPGPLAGRISYFAPVSLFFFFFLVFMLSTLRGNDLHPMNYFFLACAFFAFHLLLAYLADHISIHAAFVISSVVSIALVVSYLRLVVDLRFAVVDAGLTQLIYLVLFSYAFFFEGFTGLAVTIGAILTLFVVMQMTGRIRWEEKLGVPQLRRGGMPA